MIAIDTNVLLRLVVDDPNEKQQSQIVRDLLNQHGQAWVSIIVLIETVWVLQSCYKLTKEQVIVVIEKIIQHPRIHLDNAASVDNALTLYSACNAGFADCSILNEAKKKQLILHTFDRKLSRLHGAELIVDKD
jgi:predicted nucleic-acid-binding protein